MQLPHMNPYSRVIKKYLVNIIADKYDPALDDVADRLTVGIVNKRDAENLIRLLGALYEAGYNQAIEAAQAAMAERGLKVKVMPPKNQA
jgi:hypothetical protein